MIKIYGKESEEILENLENGSLKIEDVILERNKFNSFNDINPSSKEFRNLPLKEKTIFFQWTELNRAIDLFEDSDNNISASDTDDNGNIIVDEW